MSAAAFDLAIRFVLPHEEAFARGHWGDENFVVAENVSGDSGGVTKYGIDAASHPDVDIAALTRDQAIAIYRQEWQKHGLDVFPDRIAVALFEVWVNGGKAVAWLQTAINATRPVGPQLVVDGRPGPVTISAALLCDQDKVLRIFIDERDARFERLAQNPARHKFLAGWEERDRDLEKFLGVPGGMARTDQTTSGEADIWFLVIISGFVIVGALAFGFSVINAILNGPCLAPGG